MGKMLRWLRTGMIVGCASALVSFTAGCAPSMDGPQGFEPRSATFASAEEGWVLGQVEPCSTASCPAIRHTADGGRSWQSVSVSGLPEVSGSWWPRIYFTDSRNGWLFAADRVWRSPDGGTSWQAQLPLSGTGVQPAAMVSDGSRVMLAAAASNRLTLVTAEVDSDVSEATYPLGAGTGGRSPYVTMTGHGSAAWLAYYRDRYLRQPSSPTIPFVAGGARLLDGAWSNWSPPCLAEDNQLTDLTALSDRTLVAVCRTNIDDPAGESRLYRSEDAGLTFTDHGPIPGRRVALLGVAPKGPTMATGLSHECPTDAANAILVSDDDGLT
ncbi:hypothetical protein OG225_22795 [Nocardia sp. NBC_01377]|uniref:WD40/YVTN/BNR-like repeat-containing protein n=1 Tax=Nocardia sp. NBC_01377 TaxID=2903595 RepID=UPI00324398D9